MTTIFKHKRSIVYTAIYLLFLLSIVACSQNKTVKESDTKIENKIDSVSVFTIKNDTVKKMLILPSELIPNENAEIRAKIQGYVRKMLVDIGTKVNKGQVLALIEAPEINTRIQELKEKANASQARYLSSRDYFVRIKTASRTEGVIAAGELQRVKNQMIADSLEYKANQSSAISAKQIGKYLAIVAPYNGVITKRNIVTGSFVGTLNEKPLFELSDNSILRLHVSVPEVYTSSVLLNGKAELTTRALPDKKFEAKLVRKTGRIDEQSRSEIWEFQIPNKNNELKPGSYADAKLMFMRQKEGMVVPASAVVTTLEKKFVIKVSNGKTQWTDVRPGFNMGEKIEIFGDVKQGDTLVLKGTEELKTDMEIIPINYLLLNK
ncbi:efflux RND transporter periplasmic adaptor subunit [Flavobacterium sp. FlaQc-30]|uniref:efflux RND transporter periplasmic adaptor subunit n=1 Tax=Flavobacterium sp. FlaQc-30 TaxID=3374179 RepID=UPI003756C3EF